MLSSHRFLTALLVVLLLVMVGGSCSGVQEEGEVVIPAVTENETVTICSLDAGQIGSSVTTSGTVIYQDSNQPGGTFVLLENQGCQVGIFIDLHVWNSWEGARQGEFNQGSEVEVTGELSRHQGDLVIDILPGIATTQGEEISASGEDPDLERVELCSLKPGLVGTSLRVEGTISYLDDSDGEGVYLDLEENNCQLGSWLPRELVETKPEVLVLESQIYLEGLLLLEDGEYFLDPTGFGPYKNQVVFLDPSEMWWELPQTYHNGEDPKADFTPLMNITALHDWSSLLEGFAPQPDSYWSAENIKNRWNEAHAQGMRVEAVLSIMDMYFVEYTPEDDIYDASAINITGDHIQYDDVPGFVGCTNREEWQEFTRQKIYKAIDWGVDGIIIDDYEGSSRWTSGTPVGVGGLEFGPGGCFCPACEAGFREYLQEIYTTEELQGFGITDIGTFDYSDYLLKRGWNSERLGQESMKFSGWDSEAIISAPLYQDYADFQIREVIDFLKSLKQDALDYARSKYNKKISWSVNAGEMTYGAHQFYQMFDRSVGAIHIFGIPPRGREGYIFRLFTSITENPRLREFPSADPVVIKLLNEYQASNLWGLKGVEAYANGGALIESDFYIVEGEGLDEEAASAKNDPILKKAINTFYLKNADLFDNKVNSSLARAAVLYSSPSIHYDLYRHLQTFYGICEILTDLQVQFDPLFIGDGLSYPDNLDLSTLDRYQVVFLPNLTALTENQVNALLSYLEQGGNLVSLGRLGEKNEGGESVSYSDLENLKRSAPAPFGDGKFTSLYSPTVEMDGIYDDGLLNRAAFYYQYYIENDPAKAPFLDVIGETPGPQLGEDAAEAIRNEFDRLLDQNLGSRLIAEALPENIGVQAYSQENPDWKMILHLINYNYDLEQDRVLPQDGLDMAILIPDGREISNVSLRSPDFEGVLALEFDYQDSLLRFQVPSLLFWDVLVIE